MRISDWSSDVCSSDLFKHGETLFLMGDDARGSSKDGRRATIAAKYCVIILGGDQLGALSQQFNARDLPAAQRVALATSAGAPALWDTGWLLLPNLVYGSRKKLGWNRSEERVVGAERVR